MNIKRLKIDGVGSNKFDLIFNQMKTVIPDRHVDGSRELFEMINGWHEPLKYIEAYDYKSENIDLSNKDGKLIILINFDHLIDKFKGLADAIKNDTKNQYLIFGDYAIEKLGLSNSNIAKMVRSKSKFELIYKQVDEN